MGLCYLAKRNETKRNETKRNKTKWYFAKHGGRFWKILRKARVHYILTLVYKSLYGLAPEYITNMFSLKTHSINLRRGTQSLLIPRVNTTTYGLHSLSYYGSKLWNSLPNTTRAPFLKSPETLRAISGVTIPFVTQERRAFNSSNFAVIFLFVTLKTC